MKRIMSIMLVALVTMIMAMSCEVAHADSYLIKGKIIDGRMYLPVARFRELGLGITWYNDSKVLVIETQTETMKITQEHGLRLINGKAYAPIRHLEILDGVSVTYDPSVKGARVRVDNPGSPDSVIKIETDRSFERENDRNYYDSYRELVRAGRVYFSRKQIEKHGMEAYSNDQLARIRIKADYRALSDNRHDDVTVQEALQVFAELLKLSPQQLERTVMVNDLTDSRGRIDRHRLLTYSDLNQLVCSYFEYMGIDPFKCPAHDNAYLMLSNESRFNQTEVYNISALKWVGFDYFGEIDRYNNEIKAHKGVVDVASFNRLIRQLTLN
jgi:hypothetical protein